MTKSLYFLQVLINYYIKFGFEGVKLLFKRTFIKDSTIKIKVPFLKHSLYLRSGTSDISVFNQIFLHGEYENKYRIVPNIIVDCGANIGLSSVFFINEFPNARIIAIEPEKSNFEMLLKNAEKYQNIECLNYGIWSKSCNLLIENNGSGNWGFTTKEVDFDDDRVIKSISIEDILALKDIDYIDILKIDIESAEKEVFENISKELLNKVRVIIIELHDRMKRNCSKTFFDSIADYNYDLEFKGEYIVCYLNN